MTTDLLEPGMLARLERLQLATRRPLAGRLAGDHRSRDRGASLDFAEFREYTPGDDFRRLDYSAMARLDQLLVRLYQAEDDITVRLLIDTSGSMGHGGKLEQACRVAGALGFVALTRRDPVVIHTFPARSPERRFHGRHASAELFASLAALIATGRTALGAAAGEALQRPGPPGLTVLISDLLAEDWPEALRRLPARGGEVIVVHVLAAGDLRPDLDGDVDLVDAETGAILPISASRSLVAAYERRANAWADDVAARAKHAGASYLRLMADADLADALFGAWRASGVLR